MRYSEQEIQKTHEAMHQAASPMGAVFGALMGAAPAIAIYAYFVHMGAILYVFIFIPPAIIGLAAQFSARVYQPKHRLSVGLIACVVHLSCVYYFSYKVLFYFLVPMIFVVAFIASKRRLSPIEELVADMTEEGRFENT